MDRDSSIIKRLLAVPVIIITFFVESFFLGLLVLLFFVWLSHKFVVQLDNNENNCFRCLVVFNDNSEWGCGLIIDVNVAAMN